MFVIVCRDRNGAFNHVLSHFLLVCLISDRHMSLSLLHDRFWANFGAQMLCVLAIGGI